MCSWRGSVSGATLHLRRSQVTYPPLGQIQIISGDLYIPRPRNFYRNSSSILWTRRTHFWCPLRLKGLRSDDWIGITGASAQAKFAQYFPTIRFFSNYPGRIIEIYMYIFIYYPPTSSCRLGFFASSYTHLHWVRCRACASWTPRVRPGQRPVHTAGTLRRETCPPMTFSMPALSPPATLLGPSLVGIAQSVAIVAAIAVVLVNINDVRG